MFGKKAPFAGSYTVTVASKSGKKVDPVTGASTTTIGVYSKTDLKRRQTEAAQNPDITINARRVGRRG